MTTHTNFTCLFQPNLSILLSIVGPNSIGLISLPILLNFLELQLTNESQVSVQSTTLGTIVANGGCADVVFVHGLTGDLYQTWSAPESKEAEGVFWPRWLGTDLPDGNYFTLGYPASMFAKWAKKEMNLYERAKNTLEVLASYGIGERPVIFICHSLGGLLIKQVLRTAQESTETNWIKLAKNCIGIFFLATPHSGSSLANLLKCFVGGFNSHHVDKLVKDSSDLDELNASFRSLCANQKIEVTSYYEMHKTGKIALIVEANSADPGVNASLPIPVDADHINICKPLDRHSVIYRSVFSRLKAKLLEIAVAGGAKCAEFEGDDLSSHSESDRRDLHEKMIAADREYEYSFANESQNRFARRFLKSGLQSSSLLLHNNMLADIDQRFQSLVYYPLICNGADKETVSIAVQERLVAPLSEKYSKNSANERTVMDALYFLTERCHVRWDKP